MKKLGEIIRAVFIGVALLALFFGGVIWVGGAVWGPKPVQMLQLNDGPVPIVVCHGGVNVESDGANYIVKYPQDDGTVTTVYGVHQVRVSTLTENEVKDWKVCVQ
jgi:hypothetical protein